MEKSPSFEKKPAQPLESPVNESGQGFSAIKEDSMEGMAIMAAHRARERYKDFMMKVSQEVGRSNREIGGILNRLGSQVNKEAVDFLFQELKKEQDKLGVTSFMLKKKLHQIAQEASGLFEEWQSKEESAKNIRALADKQPE